MAFGRTHHPRTWDSTAFRCRSDPTGSTQCVPGHEAAEDSDVDVHASTRFTRIGSAAPARSASRRGRLGALTGGSRRVNIRA